MKRIRFLILGLALGLALPSAAQWRVGARVGLTTTSVTTENGYFYDWRYSSNPGLSVSVPVRYDFRDWFAVQAEVAYVQKNYGLWRSGHYEETGEDLTNHYLSLPVLAHFSFGPAKLRGYLDAGFYVGGWLAARREGGRAVTFPLTDDGLAATDDWDSPVYPTVSYDEKYAFDSRRDNRFEGGALVGVGVEWQLGGRMALQGGCRYYHSLSDVQKDYMLDRVPRYLGTFDFHVGILFPAGKK